LVSINSKNESGLPLTLCVSNYTSRKCDIYSDLSSTGKLKKDVFLLPPTDENGIGYDLNLENLGIKGTVSINMLNSIEITPIPYSFLQSIKSAHTSLTSIFTGNVETYEKYTQWLYVGKTSANPTILTLYESFEPGFKAYQVNCSSAFSCLIKGLLAPFYAMQIKEHVLVDNWANGWVINRQPSAVSHQQIAIVFMPQYFEMLGFLILILTFTLLICRLKHHRVATKS
jgi:hypothetical protein